MTNFLKTPSLKKKWNIDLYKIEKYFHRKQNAAEILDHLENEIFRATRKAFKDIKEIFLAKFNRRFTTLQDACCSCIKAHQSGKMNPTNVEWEIDTLQKLEGNCPMSIAMAFEHITNAKKKSLK